MSMLIAFGRPTRRASSAVAITPAAGPDSITWTGRRRPLAAVMTPPFDCMTRMGAPTPSARSSVSRLPR
jgi:hypothetical protein